jgi:hypothetical protein
MSQQSLNLAALMRSLNMTPKQLASFYFYEQLDPSTFGMTYLNLGMPLDVQCLFDPTKCL